MSNLLHPYLSLIFSWHASQFSQQVGKIHIECIVMHVYYKKSIYFIEVEIIFESHRKEQ